MYAEQCSDNQMIFQLSDSTLVRVLGFIDAFELDNGPLIQRQQHR